MSLRTMRQYATLPALPPRGPMPPMVGVVIPIARTNLVTNPSIELATTNYTAVGGSIARSAVWQYHGTYSLAITPSAGTNSDGAFYGSVALTNAQAYAYSLKFKATGAGIGKTYALSIATTGGVDLVVTQFIATGRPQWIAGYYLETSSTNRRLYIRKVNHSAADVFYIDGVQIEAINAGELVSTYIDGDQTGLLVGQQPPAYLWTGTPHASTSTRSALTRAGGYVVNLSLYNFLLTGIVGLGMAVPNNISVPYTVLDGARYLRTQKPPRTLTLTGRWQSDDPREQFAMASDMRAVLDRDFVPLQQPLVLMVEPQDECGNVIGDFAEITCLYAGGLEGNDGNVPVEDVAPTFTMYLPYIIGGDAGAALTVQQSVSNANKVLTRNPAGVWSAMGTGVTVGNLVDRYVRGLDGKIYAGGDFTTIGGVAANRIAYWDGAAWNAMGTGAASSIVNDMAVAPNGDIIAVGGFSGMGGIANTKMIARWNGSAWSAIGTGGDAGTTFIYSVTVTPNGDIYVAGDFTSIGGVAAANIAKWNGSAWSALSTGLTGGSADGLFITNDSAGNVYVGGGFTTAGGVTAANIAKWNGSAFSALGSGLGTAGSNHVRAIVVAPNGIVYAGGIFTVSGSASLSHIGAWNGTSWSQLGTGLNNDLYAMSLAPDGTLYASGTFTTAGGIVLPDSMARWNGSAWLPLDVDLPGSATVYVIKAVIDGSIYLGFDQSGTATAAANTNVTNDTPSYVYPRLIINGPSSGTSRIYQIVNYTTGFGIWLNLTLNAGEVATLDFNPQAPSFTTTFQGDITNKILPGSQSALFYLAPGVNTISFFAASSTVVATLSWQRRCNGVADLVN